MAWDKRVIFLEGAQWTEKGFGVARLDLDNESLRAVSVNYDKELQRLLEDHEEFRHLVLDVRFHGHHQGNEEFPTVISLHGPLVAESLFDKNHRLLLPCPRAEELWQKVQSEGVASGEELPPDPGAARAIVSEEEACQDQVPLPPLENLSHLLKSRFPMLYDQVLEPTLADLRFEHSAALSEGHPGKAHWKLLRGCGALAAAAACQLGFCLLDRIAAFWKTRSIK